MQPKCGKKTQARPLKLTQIKAQIRYFAALEYFDVTSQVQKPVKQVQ